MKTPAQKLADRLEAEGWDVHAIHTRDLEWWADEVWELRSRWAPRGAAAYITFLVDPQHEGPRNQGQSVWGVGCSAAFPASRHDAEAGGTVSMRALSKQEKQDMDAFFERLAQARQLFDQRME